IPALEVGVFVGGAAVCLVTDGASLDLAVIEPHLALEAVQTLFDLPEAVLVYQDASLTGHDYLVTGRGSLSPQTQWWFERTESRVRFAQDVTLDDLHHTLRVGIVSTGERMAAVKPVLRDALGERVFLQSFEAVQEARPGVSVHVLEVFAQGVDKWRGIEWLARQRGVAPEQVAVIGDEVNDLAMLRGAGCGIAMANAIDPVKQAARHVTLTCDQHGVAHAIDKLLREEW
ncbi:MAG: HAD hydrolase family protein, partial [Phycisphaeraceae bacterium]|nr:HAD hydrolase family protein [Phycisphaeraceae bacterium]